MTNYYKNNKLFIVSEKIFKERMPKERASTYSYKCDINSCEKLYKSKFSLKRHMNTHKVNKKFKCNQC